VKRTALVQHSQALDVLALPAGARVAVVDFLDLGGFSAPPVVAMLAWIAELARADLHVVPVTVARTLSDMDIFGTCFEMAGALDDDNTRGRILHALNDALLAVGATHVLLPPVLGRARAAVVHADVHAALARPIAELLALPASAPGERLQHALHAALRERGVVVIDGGVDAAVVEQERVQSLQVRSGAQVQRVVPRAVVLASGRFLGGGLLRDQDARERVFGLPVVVDGVPLADRFIGDVLGDVVDSAHAVFRAGVAVDAQLRPVDVRGQVLLHNVFAAGSVIEGYDPARDGTAAGAAALTGLLAGEHAADEARRARSS
jgi:glycerol-3-phosphate dehydrogenase subunit B